MRKKYASMLLVSLLLTFCIGCANKGDQEKGTFFEQKIVSYDIDDLHEYTVDEDENLYAITSVTENNNEVIYTLSKYDFDGVLIYSRTIEELANVNSVVAVDGIIYFTTASRNDNGLCNILFSYNEESSVVNRLYDFEQFERVKQLVYCKNRIFALGYLIDTHAEQLVYYSVEEAMSYELGIEQPISMAVENETIMIQANLTNEGYCILRYQPDKDELKVVARFDEQKFDQFAVCDSGTKVIYTYPENSRGIVLSKLDELDVEAEIYCEQVLDIEGLGIYYSNEQVYAVDNQKRLFRFSLSDVEQEANVITYISPGYQQYEPYGCGYAMRRLELDYDQFALKVLAQDQDYDLCIMNSSYDNSYNFRKNGSFYPLNDIDGIDEYLDQCLPYVKDAAINQENDIWMLPIQVEIPGFVVNTEVCEQLLLELRNNMTYDEFSTAISKMTEEDWALTSANSYTLNEAFLEQYFSRNVSVDTDIFRREIPILQQINSEMPQYLSINDYFYEKEFAFVYCNNQAMYELTYQKSMNQEHLAVYGMPKLDANDKDTGSCIYLAVNPNSKNLKDTLKYLESWIQYQLYREDKPLYMQSADVELDSFSASLHQLYENGEIAFQIDCDLYEDGFFNLVEEKEEIENYISETDRKLNAYFNE